MPPQDYRLALDVAVAAAREAGQWLRQEFHRPEGPHDIDHDVETVIKRLLVCLPWNYLGEELGHGPTVADPHVWVVDPNDGTKQYLQGRRGSAVSIAALRDGVPVLGVVYAFAYPDDNGDLIAWAEGCGPITRNGEPVKAGLIDADLSRDGLAFHDRLIVFNSADADHNPIANTSCVRPARYLAVPSIAYRLALVAAGEGVAAVSLNNPVSWDYAAGHALLKAAGGVLVNRSGKPITYTKDGESSCDGACFGGGVKAVADLRQRDWQKVLKPTNRTASPPFALVGPRPGRTVSDASMLARAQGCLFGQLAGDSLGGLVEFRGLEEIRRAYPQGVRDLQDGGAWGNLAGQPTDDSEMALMLARTLVHLGHYDRGAVLDAYVHWWPRAWDRGGTLRQALAEAYRGKTTAEREKLALENANRHSQANGCLMRISPLGIFGASRVDQVSDWARSDSQLTHPHPACGDCCAIYTKSIAHAIAHSGDAEAVYRVALAEANKPNIQPSVRQVVQDARQAPPDDYVTHMGWVLIALQNAFYQLLHAPTLEEGIVDTIAHGGDTDTTAAIAGALLGAVHGRQAIPPRWLRALLSCRPLPGTPTRHEMPEEFWPVDVLDLAEALLAVGLRGEI